MQQPPAEAAMFAAFGGDAALGGGGGGLPVGSRLVQYLQGGNSAPAPQMPGNNVVSWSPTPVMQQGPSYAAGVAPGMMHQSQPSHMSGYIVPQFAQLSVLDEKNGGMAQYSSVGPVSPHRHGGYSGMGGTHGMSPSSTMMSSDSAMYSDTSSSFMQETHGGTTYFFQPTENAVDPSQMQADPLLTADNRVIVSTSGSFAYTGPLPHIGRFRPKGLAATSYFTPQELKMELMNRQMAVQCRADPHVYPDLPSEVEHFQLLVPLETPRPPSPALPQHERTFFGNLQTTVYKATSSKDGLTYALRRIHNYRLSNMKSLSMADTWKKLIHANVVQLREMFVTRHFGDASSLVFVFDYHPLAETLKARHFTASNQRLLNGGGAPYMDQGGGGPKFGGSSSMGSGGNGGVLESLIWTYVVQLSSALRAIHASGMAARAIDPSKIVVVGKSKLMINCCGIPDVLAADAGHQSMIPQQQEDLIGLGRLVVALACGSLTAARRENLSASIQYISQHYSSDMKNLIAYLLGHSTQANRPRSINDVMPMIGARFYAQLEAAQMRNDLLENELGKELENGRLFRLLCKLGTINERPEYNLSPEWSETGDRYLLKLFRDYLFHQVTDDGKPWLDLAHVVQCLNKDWGHRAATRVATNPGVGVCSPRGSTLLTTMTTARFPLIRNSAHVRARLDVIAITREKRERASEESDSIVDP